MMTAGNVFAEWLKVSKLNEKDALFILSVGGATLIENQRKFDRLNPVGKERSARVFGIVGRADGFTYQQADICSCPACQR